MFFHPPHITFPDPGDAMKRRSSAVQMNRVAERNRATLLKFLIVLVPMWLSAKFYVGPYQDFVRNYLAAVVVIVLLGVIFQAIFLTAQEKNVLIALFVVLSAFQIFAMVLPSFIAKIAFTLAETTFLGGEYSYNMIPYYGVGAFIGYFLLKGSRKKKD
jgi:hypothetical protein